MTHLPHQQRVVDELAALEASREKLAAFLKSKPRAAQAELKLLVKQYASMGEFADLLRERIALFVGPENRMAVYQARIPSDADPFSDKLTLVAVPLTRFSAADVPSMNGAKTIEIMSLAQVDAEFPEARLL